MKMLHDTEHSGSQKIKAQSRKKRKSDVISPVKGGDVALWWFDHATDQRTTDQTTSKLRI